MADSKAKGRVMGKFLSKRIVIIGIGCVSLIAIGVIAAIILTGGAAFRLWQLEWKKQGHTDLRFTEVELPFRHDADLDNSLPFMAAAAIDIDADGKEELFLGGGKGQDDALFRFKNGAFQPISAAAPQFLKNENDATHGAASIDVNGDGLTDLFTARESGIWLHINIGGGFDSRRLNLPLADNTTPLSIALGDVNKDGWVDFYVSGYLKNNLVEGQTIFTRPYGGYSYLFMNNGDNTWRDATKEAGLWRQHNTFTAVFADIDNDADSDLVIAQDTGVVEIYENTGVFPFQRVDNPSVSSYPMGVAAGDFDNDGLIDFYFSNVGHTLPETMLRGDLPDGAAFNPSYMLFRNLGDRQFSDVAKQTRTARIGFGWGVVFADMNLDGREDLLAAQNYARFPGKEFLHKYACKVMLQYPDGTFKPVEKRTGAVNRNYAIAPVVADFNDDGNPDLVWANIGGPAKAFINTQPERAWIKIRLPDNAASLNAIVTIRTDSETVQSKQLVASQGLGSDQTAALIFGLGKATAASRVDVHFQDGKVVTVDTPPLNETLIIAHPTQVQ
jgi:enediyne biosynthesis protein E4